MKTVKQVSDLTGISVRTLHYYDEIGLVKPTEISSAGYRLYGDEVLETLQQVLFFRELDFPLKQINEILNRSGFDKKQALDQHKKLLVLKRNRLNALIELVRQIEEGEDTVSFKAFDLSEYYAALETFKTEHTDEVTRYWGSVDRFTALMEEVKSKEGLIAEVAVKQYGSVEQYTQAMKHHLASPAAIMEHLATVQTHLADYQRKSDDCLARLTADLTKDTATEEVQQMVGELVREVAESAGPLDMGDNYWGMMGEAYRVNPVIIEATDKRYGAGAAAFIGAAIEEYVASLKA